jgi:hypothetical protein
VSSLPAPLFQASRPGVCLATVFLASPERNFLASLPLRPKVSRAKGTKVAPASCAAAPYLRHLAASASRSAHAVPAARLAITVGLADMGQTTVTSIQTGGAPSI